MPRRSGSTAAAASPKAPGAFLSDGSYSERGELRHRGHIDRLVRALCAQRREGRLSIEMAVLSINAASAKEAFPNVAQWALCEHWAMVWTSTSAEEAVKREGRGVFGYERKGAHWCGQRWAEGPESSCPEECHRAVRRPYLALVGSLMSSMSPEPSSATVVGQPDADGDIPPPPEVAHGS